MKGQGDRERRNNNKAANVLAGGAQGDMRRAGRTRGGGPQGPCAARALSTASAGASGPSGSRQLAYWPPSAAFMAE